MNDICAREIAKSFDETVVQLATIELHAGGIAEQLKRIADALELLATAIQPQFKDRDATLNIQAVCYTQEI